MSSSYTQQLSDAIIHREAAQVRALIQQDPQGVNALYHEAPMIDYAVLYGTEEILQMLLDAGAKANVRIGGEPLIHHAVRRGDSGIMRTLIAARDLNLNATDSFQNTALDTAVMDDANAIVSVLLDANPIVYSDTVHYAVKSSSKEILQMLLATGVDVNERSSSGEYPIHTAVERGDHGIMRTLIFAERLNPNVTAGMGRTALHMAALKHDAEMVDLLLDASAKPDVKDILGLTPMDLLEVGDEQIAASLAVVGADANQAKYALGGRMRNVFEAIKKNDIHAAKRAIKAMQELNEDVNKTDLVNNNAMYYALDSEYALELVRLLIDAGADVNARFPSHSYPIVTAVSRRNVELVKILLENNAHTDVLDIHGRPLIMVSVYGVYDPDAVTSASWEQDANEIVRMLIYYGADVNARYLNQSVMTTLMQHVPIPTKVIETLLKANVDANATDMEGKTLLITAILKGNLEVVEMLFDHGANIDGRSFRFNWTPLMVAVEQDRKDLIHFLIARGANETLTVTIKNKNNALTKVTAVQMARTETTRNYLQSLIAQRDAIRQSRRPPRQLATMMSLHQRLGSQSPLGYLGKDIVTSLSETYYIDPDEVYELPQYHEP